MTTTHPVYIVGAGPGDPGLLTIKAYKLLTEYAEVVIYDRLIPDELMDMVPESVERIYAGKSCKKHTMTQDEINQALVDQAMLGKKVVRLKGGDPFIFGRGGEEVEFLSQNNISSEVVPGITAAGGISAKLGVPLTHRGLATAVRFITGHQQKGQPVVHDWGGLANPDCTLVIYMGLANLEIICDNIIKAGLEKDTPAMVVQEGTYESERKVISTIEYIAKEAQTHEFKAPSLVIIGKVVSLAT